MVLQFSWLHCFKTQETKQFSPIGTLCGFITTSSVSTHSPITIYCNDLHPLYQACPKGYERQMIGGSTTCVKMVEYQEDLPGTRCGMHAHKEYNYQYLYYANQRCNGYDVENGYCPPGYQYTSGNSGVWYVSRIIDVYSLRFCFKT